MNLYVADSEVDKAVLKSKKKKDFDYMTSSVLMEKQKHLLASLHFKVSDVSDVSPTSRGARLTYSNLKRHHRVTSLLLLVIKAIYRDMLFIPSIAVTFGECF